MSKYNGHKNWNHWNVSLWINNDQGLYYSAVFYAKHYRKAHGNGLTGRQRAVNAMLQFLKDSGITHTPDGAPYSKTTILAAMRGII